MAQKVLRLSPHRLNLYRQCPRRYHYQYVENLGRLYAKPRAYFSFGSALHRALRDFYRLGGPFRRPVEDLLALYHAAWQGAGFPSPESEAEARREGEEILRTYHAKHKHINSRTIFVERQPECPLTPHLRLFGQLDRLDLTAEGEYEVVDYKSGRHQDESHRIQLLIYGYLVRQTYALFQAPLNLTIYYLRDNYPQAVVPMPGEEERVLDEVKAVGEEILTAQHFPAQPGPLCATCDFNVICPDSAFRPGDEPLEPVPF
ncbi:MAG: PD-(D/E)XK nuclease family protein [Deinococcus sp.]|nr:PD-(D/E)XK nuclease family protein [Deinococcus sp.]